MSDYPQARHPNLPVHRSVGQALLILSGILLLLSWSVARATPDTAEMRAWVAQMKASERGPFAGVLWFCADGQRLPPKAYACVSHGGGKQHGELGQHARTLRANGYYLANVLAAIDPDTFLQQKDAGIRLKHMLVEQFLIRSDDGWIMRRARFYRGALQDEDERRAAQQLLLRLVQVPGWPERKFLLLRTAVRLLDHGSDSHTVTAIRQRAADLGQRDPAFAGIRNKIHAKPDQRDILRVRAYAHNLNDPALAVEYLELADPMQQAYSPLALAAQLQEVLRRSRAHPVLSRLLTRAQARLSSAQTAQQRFTETAALMAQLRDRLSGPYEAGLRLALLDTSLILETAHCNAANELGDQLPSTNRLQRLRWLRSGVEAAYGAGLLSKREQQALDGSLSHLSRPALTSGVYKRELDYLARAPAWASRQLAFHFQGAEQRLGDIEPLARQFDQDLLRGSPMFFYSRVLDGLSRDANHLVGVRKRLFGREIGTGMRGLNPGIATGILRLPPAGNPDRPP